MDKLKDFAPFGATIATIITISIAVATAAILIFQVVTHTLTLGLIALLTLGLVVTFYTTKSMIQTINESKSYFLFKTMAQLFVSTLTIFTINGSFEFFVWKYIEFSYLTCISGYLAIVLAFLTIGFTLIHDGWPAEYGIGHMVCSVLGLLFLATISIPLNYFGVENMVLSNIGTLSAYGCILWFVSGIVICCYHMFKKG